MLLNGRMVDDLYLPQTDPRKEENPFEARLTILPLSRSTMPVMSNAAARFLKSIAKQHYGLPILSLWDSSTIPDRGRIYQSLFESRNLPYCFGKRSFFLRPTQKHHIMNTKRFNGTALMLTQT